MRRSSSRCLRPSTIPSKRCNILRRWKRREMLRIGTRDLLRRETVQTVAAQLSDLACVAIDFALAIVTRQLLDAEGRDAAPGTFAVIATGRLGAQEMSYSSDIELLYVYDASGVDEAGAAAADAFFVKAGCDLTAALRDETHEGHLYRVVAPTMARHRRMVEGLLAGPVRRSITWGRAMPRERWTLSESAPDCRRRRARSPVSRVRSAICVRACRRPCGCCLPSTLPFGPPKKSSGSRRLPSCAMGLAMRRSGTRAPLPRWKRCGPPVCWTKPCGGSSTMPMCFFGQRSIAASLA